MASSAQNNTGPVHQSIRALHPPIQCLHVAATVGLVIEHPFPGQSTSTDVLCPVHVFDGRRTLSMQADITGSTLRLITTSLPPFRRGSTPSIT